jgi:hypothetical protein
MAAFTKQEAALRAAEITAQNSADRDAVERLKTIPPIPTDEPVPESVTAATAAVSRARELHDHLLGQKLVAEARKAEHVHTRKALAFSALTGDGSAKRRLDEVTAAEIAADRDIANLNAAIATAVDKVKQDEALLARAVERERAKEALSLAEQLGQHAAGFDTAVRQLLASYDALDRVCAALCAITRRPSRVAGNHLSDLEKDRHIRITQLDYVEEGLLLPGITDRACVVDPVVRHCSRPDAGARRYQGYQNSGGKSSGHGYSTLIAARRR